MSHASRLRQGNSRQNHNVNPFSDPHLMKPNARTPATFAHPTESHTIVFEWPLTGLKSIFESSKPDVKSKVVKSVPFGDGRWTILFYAQSGHDNNASIYLNAEPLHSERLAHFATPSPKTAMAISLNPSEQHDAGWERQGLFRFTFTIRTIDKSTVLGSKEAHDHAFSYKTSNWGWAQFIKRDAVYFNNATVKQTDSFLITVSIQSSASRPAKRSVGMTIPPPLVQAYGTLLDDPEHSDVVFHLVTPRHRQGTQGSSSKYRVQHIYAIKKILAARSEYFKDMFESGFSEGETNDADDQDLAAADDLDGDELQDESSSDCEGEDDQGDIEVQDHQAEPNESALPSSSTKTAAMPSSTSRRPRKTAKRARVSTSSSVDYQEHEPLLHDSDAEIEFDEESVDGDDTEDSKKGIIQTKSSSTARVSPVQDGRKRRKVVVRDSSYTTFKALLYFLYTDTIDFAPLTSSFIDARAMGETWGRGSRGSAGATTTTSTNPVGGTVIDFNAEMLKAHARRQEAIEQYHRKFPSLPSPCSAKAMYRLADKLQIPDLKSRSQEHLYSSLTVHNIVWEAFSSFTSQFADVRKLEVDYLLRHWQAVKKTSAMKTIFTRAHAHPGLAEVWPHLLSQLDYRMRSGSGGGSTPATRSSIGGSGSGAGADEEDFGAHNAGDEHGQNEGDDDDDDEDDDDDDDDALLFNEEN